MSEIDFIMEVGGESFDLKKRGGAQAKQIANLLKWLGKYATPIITEFSEEDGSISFDDTFQFLMKLADVLDEEALLQAWEIALGCDREFTNEHFDIIVLADALELLFKNDTYQMALERFFGMSFSRRTTEESSTN